MAVFTEQQQSLLTYRNMEEQQPLSLSAPSASVSVSASSENHSNPSDAVIFFGLSLALGIACRHLLRGTRVPYTVALLILGIALGSLGSYYFFIFLLLFLLTLLNHLSFLWLRWFIMIDDRKIARIYCT
jgi:hypothetical protein